MSIINNLYYTKEASMSDENLVLLLLGLMRHTISEIIETLGFAFERSLLLYLPM